MNNTTVSMANIVNVILISICPCRRSAVRRVSAGGTESLGHFVLTIMVV